MGYKQRRPTHHHFRHRLSERRRHTHTTLYPIVARCGRTLLSRVVCLKGRNGNDAALHRVYYEPLGGLRHHTDTARHEHHSGVRQKFVRLHRSRSTTFDHGGW